MRPEQQRVHNVLMDTITLLCKNSLQFSQNLRIQGVIGITTDDYDVFLVHINETIDNVGCSSGVQQIKQEVHHDQEIMEQPQTIASSPFKTPTKRPQGAGSSLFNRQNIGVKSFENGPKFSGDQAVAGPSEHSVGNFGMPLVRGIRATKTTYGSGGSTAISSTVVTESYVLGPGDVEPAGNLYSVSNDNDAYNEQNKFKAEGEQMVWNDGSDQHLYDNAYCNSQTAVSRGKARLSARGRGSRGGIRGVVTGRGGRAQGSPAQQSPSRLAARSSGDNPYVITESTHLCGYPDCGKRFRFKQDLLRHQTKVHGRQPAVRGTSKKAAMSQSGNEGYDGMVAEEYYDGVDEYNDEASY